MKKGKKKSPLVFQILTMLEIAAALTISAFSWFEESTSTEVNQFQLSVSSSSGLYIVLNGNEQDELSEVDLRTLLGETPIPTLIQSSSKNGINFVTLDASTIDPNAEDYWSTASFVNATMNVHYLQFSFFLLTEMTRKDIFLSENLSLPSFQFKTIMEDNTTESQIGPTRAMRISMTFGTNDPIILGTTAENDNSGYETLAVVTTGNYINPNAVSTGRVEYGQVVHTIDEYYLGYEDGDGYFKSAAKTERATPIATIEQGVLVPVTVRIWLEGGDPDCVNTSHIVDTVVNIKLDFCAKEHQDVPTE